MGDVKAQSLLLALVVTACDYVPHGASDPDQSVGRVEVHVGTM